MSDPSAWSVDARDLFENAPDGLLIVDPSGRIVQVNVEVERLFGWPRGELVGQPIETLVPPRVRETHVVHRQRYGDAARRRGMGAGMALRGLRRDGTEVAVEVALSPIAGGGGRFVLAAVRDVSDREAAQRAAQVSLERLVSALESSQDAFAIFDEHDRLVLCNSAYRRALPTTFGHAITGASYETLVDQLSTSLALEGDTLDALRARLRAYHQKPVGAFEVTTQDGHALRIVERATPEGGRVVTIVDLTEDVRRERELRSAREAAETANAAKSEFLRSMSHELRTPLNAVLGFTQLLQRDAALNERSQRFVGHVLRGGEHLLRLIDDVLDLARVEAGAVSLSLEPVSAAELLEDVRATLAPLADRRRATIEVAPLAEDLPLLHADRTRLRQIVLNYGSNGIKYGREGGHLILRASRAGDRARITVVDDGPGIPLERQERLFQAFYRAGQETGPIEGTGIGLALSRRLAEMMAGTVGFESQPGRGSEFWVELGVSGGDTTARDAAAPAPSRSLDLGGDRAVVLYVEDNPANVAFMEALLSDLGRVKLVVAPTGEIGVELARVHRPRVVILDINLPGISGFEALRRLREMPETAKTPVIALSASAMERDVKRAREAGFQRYLTKPVRVDELIDALGELLDPPRPQ